MDQAFPTPANSLNPSDSSDGTKVSLPSRGTIQAFYQLICPWYQSQFEHYLVYNLGMKLWVHKGNMLFDAGWPWYSLDFRENWLKWNFFFLGNCKAGSFSICDWKRLGCKVSFHSSPKKRQWQRMFKLPHSCTHLTR